MQLELFIESILALLRTESFWFTVCFIIFICAVYSPLKNYLNNILTLKINAIHQQIKDGEALKKQASELLIQVKYQTQLIKEENSKKHHAMEATISEMMEARKEEIDSYISKKYSSMVQELERKKASELQSLHASILALAHQMAANYISSSKELITDEKIYKEAIEKSLKH